MLNIRLQCLQRLLEWLSLSHCQKDHCSKWVVWIVDPYAPGFLFFFYDLESLVDDGYAQLDMYLLLLLLGFWQSLRKEMGFRWLCFCENGEMFLVEQSSKRQKEEEEEVGERRRWQSAHPEEEASCCCSTSKEKTTLQELHRHGLHCRPLSLQLKGKKESSPSAA